MIIGRIAGCSRVLGKEQGFNGLPIRDEIHEVGGEKVPAMRSAWFPTPGELEQLKAGGHLHLCVLGTTHPPVTIVVEPVPKEKNGHHKLEIKT